MSEPKVHLHAGRIEFDIGETRYGQKLTLFLERDTSGAIGWTLVKDPANQRDDHQRLSGISSDTIRRMAAAIREAERIMERKL